MRLLFPTGLLIVLIGCVSCSRLATKGMVVDSQFKPFIPADANVLAGVKIDKLLTSPLYKTHGEILDLRQLNTFTERTGFNPERDLTDALGAWNGKRWMAMARGHFNQSQLEAKLDLLGARPRRYKSYTLFGDDNNSLAFVQKGLVLTGSADAIEELMGSRDKGETGIPSELEEQLRDLSGNDQIWIVSRGGLPLTNIPMRSEISSAMSNIVGYVSHTSTGIRLDTGIHLQSDLTCTSDEGAQRVRDALRGGIGFARLTTRDDQLDLLRLYDAIHIEQEKAMIHIRGDLDAELANKLLAYIPRAKKL